MAVDASGLRNATRIFAARVSASAADARYQTLRRRAPRDTGELRDTSYVRLRQAGPVLWVYEVVFPAEQASYTDKGTRRHPIVGRPLLVFYWPKVGKVVFLPKVNHPGNKGTKWWTDGYTDSQWGADLRAAARRIEVRA